MLNYIGSELTRIYKKKSNYIFYISLLVIFTLSLFFSLSERTADSLAYYGFEVITFSVTIFGTQIYYAVYGDDYTYRTQTLVFSTGLSKLKYLIAKLFVFIIMVGTIYLVMALYYYLIWFLLVGNGPNLADRWVQILVIEAIHRIPTIIGFGLLASILSAFFQSANAGGILYPFLSMGLIARIFELLSHSVDWLAKPFSHLLTMQLYYIPSPELTIEGKMAMLPLSSGIFLAILGYIVVGILLATLALSYKDTKVS